MCENRDKMGVMTNEKMVLTSLSEFDQFTGGLKGGQVIVLASRPAMGKTTFALNATWNICHNKNNSVAYMSLEYNRSQMVQRLVGMISGVSRYKIANGNLDDAERETIANAAEEISQSGVIFDSDQDNDLETLIVQCVKYVKERGVSLVVFDHIQLVKYENGIAHSRSEEVEAISCELKRIAEELNVPILLLVQIDRTCDNRRNHRPLLRDIRESKELADLADIVVFLYRDDYYYRNSAEKGKAELIIAKHPGLNGGTKTIVVTYSPQKGFGNACDA